MILGQIVHNERVVHDMERLGFPTVESIEENPGGTIVFSAHGVPPSFHENARAHGSKILDTTCKFVYDIHREAKAAIGDSYHLVFIGDPQHREVIGYTNDLDPSLYHVVHTIEDAAAVDWTLYPRIKIIFQTTLNAEEFDDVVRLIEQSGQVVKLADTICYATKENQDAARELAADPEVDLIVVIGGKASANTRHLWDICVRTKPSYFVQGADDLDASWFAGAEVVGVTAGASTPDYVLEEVERRIEQLGAVAQEAT